MKAIILAGKKDLNITQDMPKELLKVGNITILERQISILLASGLKKQDILVVTGYKHERIEKIHPNTVFNDKYLEYGNAYGVYLALSGLSDKSGGTINEDLLILDGDLVYDADLINQIINSDKENLLVTKPVEYLAKIKDEIIISEKNTNLTTNMIILQKGEKLPEKYKCEKLHTYLGIIKLSSGTAFNFRNIFTNQSFFDGWYTIPLLEIMKKEAFYNLSIPQDLRFTGVDTLNDYNKVVKMFVAGPVNVSQKVKDSTIYLEIGHREPEFMDLFKELRRKLLYSFGVSSHSDKYETIICGGSGTSAMEMTLSSVLHSNKKTLVITNGSFGERIVEICNLYNIPTIHFKYEWGEYPNINEINNKLKQNQDIESVAMVLMETSTGMLNPVNEIGKLCREHEKIFIVDAISALWGEKLNVIEDNIDYCVTNTNKCLGGLPVLGIICYKKSSLEKVKNISPRSYSLDLIKHAKYAEKDQTPFTPMIPLFYMLNQALDELIEEGIENRIQRYKRNGDLLKSELKEIGLSFHLKKEEMSNLMVNILVPENLTYNDIHSKMKERGYVFYPGKGPLEGRTIHLANIGTLTEQD
ncbi:MAG TPA: aminotransferase class V-fold PLP-dependent enzyme, partial [Candidatus Pacearchaeota archaeon]|nr:aminotransferase class V-fold PLP-dependent enzyme [Candidatus Pacearchaeota archaeon]